MKIALISDMQLMLDNPRGRLDNAHEAQKRKLGYLLDWCVKNNAILLQSGDFCDKARSWYLLNVWVRFFARRKIRKELPDIEVVYGQHDTHMYSESTRKATILGTLIDGNLVELLTKEPLRISDTTYGSNVKFIDIYGCSYGQEIPEVEDGRKGIINILVIHKMIVPHKLWAEQEDAIYAPKFLNEHKDFDLILCGDCHRKFLFKSVDKKERIICNTGCMIRHIADEYSFGYAPGFYIYNTETRKVKWHEIPYEPAEKVLSREHIEKEKETNERLSQFVEAVSSKEIKGTVFKDNLRMLVRKEEVGQSVKDRLAEVMDEEIG